MDNSVDIKVDYFSIFQVLYETYFEKSYNIDVPYQDVVILDIGMNIGIVSLFFASKQYVSKVYSYEPFPGTFQNAINNFNANPILKEKIIPFNYGISNTTTTMEVPLFDDGSIMASTSVEGIKAGIHQAKGDAKINISIKDIKEVIQAIITDHPNQKIYLKIDCEGEEYNIMDRLNQVGYLQNYISGFLIEWHNKGPQQLVKTLYDNGFSTLEMGSPMFPTIGMIYAFKQGLN
jgi:FkbM family methyltransferase